MVWGCGCGCGGVWGVGVCGGGGWVGGFDGAGQSGDQESLVKFRLVSALLVVSGDPDAGVFKDYAE